MTTLLEKRRFWLKCLYGEDRHSVVRQIYAMMWNAAAFRVVNEARTLAPTDQDGRVKLSGLLHDLLNRCFFVSQAAAIRRLKDTSQLQGRYGVYSLVSLLKDMREHCTLLTRGQIFKAEGIPYDYEPIQRAAEEYRSEQIRAGRQTWDVPMDLVWGPYESRHGHIDRLSGVSAENRSADDAICPQVLDQLKSRVEVACKTVAVHVDKFIAHAATPESRAGVEPESAGITLSHIWKAHEAICQTTNFISIYILGNGDYGFLAAPLFDQFQYMERPLVDAHQIDKLRGVWDAFEREARSWADWDLDQYEEEFGPIGSHPPGDYPGGTGGTAG